MQAETFELGDGRKVMVSRSQDGTGLTIYINGGPYRIIEVNDSTPFTQITLKSDPQKLGDRFFPEEIRD